VSINPIAGLDVHSGLRRVMGNVPRYQRLLETWVETQHDLPQRLRAAVEAGDYASAELLAHSARGASGNLGAAVLAEQARLLEQQCKAHQPVDAMQAALDSFAHDVNVLQDAIRAALPLCADAAIAPHEAATPAELQQLLALLQDDDAEAAEAFDNLAPGMRVLLGDEATDAVANAIHKFDFDVALAALREATQHKGVASS
jgi:two-component system sensor histidine kinase/response regulator